MARKKRKKTSGVTRKQNESAPVGVLWDPVFVGGALFLLGAGYFFWSMPLRGLILLAAAGGCLFAAFRRRS